MKKLRLNDRRTVIIALTVILCCAVSLSLLFIKQPSSVKAEPQFENGFSTKTDYIVNDNFALPTYSFTLNGETKTAETVLIAPSGTAYSAATVALNETGFWTLRFEVTFDKVYHIEKTLTVRKSTYEITGGGSVEIGTSNVYDQGDGLLLQLKKGSTFRYNEVIDLSNLTLNDGIIRLGFMPASEGSAEVTSLIVRLTDIYDSENYVEYRTLNPNLKDTDAYPTAASLTIGFSGEPNTVGCISYNKDTGLGTYWINNSFYGAYTEMSYYGYCTGLTTLSFDYATQSCHSLNKKWQGSGVGFVKTLIADLDDTDLTGHTLCGSGKGFSKPFGGFTTGEVYLSVYATGYSSASCGVFIKSILDANFYQETSKDVNKPIINVDLDGYEEDSLPKAKVGVAYPLFNATAVDNEMQDVDVLAKVYLVKGKNYVTRVSVKNNAFIPSDKAQYAIVYTATDGYGNVAEKVLYVEAENNSFTPQVTLAEHETTCNVGNACVLADATAEVYSGNPSVVKTVYFGSEKVAENVNSFVPEKAGTYTVKIIVKDYIGLETEVSYDVTVTVSNKPLLLKEPVLPYSFIAGASYTLPAAVALDYASETGTCKEVQAKIYAIANNDETLLTDGKFTAPDGVSCVTIKYAFEGVETLEWIKEVPVIKNSNLSTDLVNYFLTDENANAKQYDDSVVVYFDKDTTVRFAKFVPMLSTQVSLNVYSEGESDNKVVYNNAERVNIYFYDTQDRDNAFMISLFRNEVDEASKFSVNNGKTYFTNGTFDGIVGMQFSFKYTGKTKTLGFNSENIVIDKTLSGETFKGFSGDKAYIEFEVVGMDADVEKNFGLEVINIAGQGFFNTDVDMQGPVISVDGEPVFEYAYGEEIKTFTATALDVLQENSTCTISVRTPSENFAVSKDGTTLKNVSAAVSYDLVLNEYGYYTVTYTGKDSFGRSNTKKISYYIPDKEAPTITLSKTSVTCKVGQKVKLPTATVSDNCSTIDAISCYLMYYSPNGQCFLIDNVKTGNKFTGEYTFDQVGEWKVVYFVYDEYYNVATVEVIVEVRK